MKAASRPESGQGKHLFALRLSRSTPFLAYLLIFACVLSLALIPGPRESSASAVHSSPRASWAGASSAVLRPFSCPSQTKQRVAQACSGKLDGKKGAASAACSLADLSSSESEIKTLTARAQEDGQQNAEAVAICLIGGARSFELTGASLHRNLLQAYDNSDVFFISSPDKDSYKLSVLSMLSQGRSSQEAQGSSRFVVLNMSQQQHIAASLYPIHRLSVPHLQGQLQQFLKLETCADAVSVFETALGRLYSWILWTRLDSYWHTPPPPLASLDPQAYHVPSAFSWGGYNDRFGMATHDVALQAMRRLSWFQHSESFFGTLLHDNTTSLLRPSPNAHLSDSPLSSHADGLAGMPISGLNSEKLLKLQLLAQGIKVREIPLGFCIITFARRRYAIASLRSGQAVNGTSCRPCAQNSAGICPQRAVHSGWREAFQQGAREDESTAAAHLEHRGVAACRAEWVAFQDMFCFSNVPKQFRAC